jgi:hypothetical protein
VELANSIGWMQMLRMEQYGEVLYQAIAAGTEGRPTSRLRRSTCMSAAQQNCKVVRWNPQGLSVSPEPV